MAKSVLTAKYPTVKIASATYTLVPTLAAVRKITQSAGGILSAYRRSNDMDIDVTAAVIAAGANIVFKDQDEADAFAEAVWREERKNYTSGLSEFFILLFQGGKPKEDEEPSEKKEGEGNS